MSELDSDFDFDAHLAAYEDSRQLALEVTAMVDDLTFGLRGLDPQTNAARVEFLEHQLALPAGERDELVTTSRLGDEWEQVAQELVEGGGDIGAFVRREYPASAAEVTRGISEATADWPASLSTSSNLGHQEGITSTYRGLLDADRVVALHLGVPGADADADAERFELAQALKGEERRRDEAAYANTDWNSEPNLKTIFGLDLLLAAEGSVQRALDDPHFVQALEDDLGFGSGFELVNDEDGLREEPVESTATFPENAEQIRRELDHINVVVADGWSPEEAPAVNTVERETPQVNSGEHEHQPRPDDDTVGQGGVTPDQPTSEDEQVEPDDPRVVVDVDHHIRQSAALAARAGRLLGAPVRGARAVAGGVVSVADALTPKSPLARRMTRLAQQAGSMATNDMEDHPTVNHTRSPGLHR